MRLLLLTIAVATALSAGPACAFVRPQAQLHAAAVEPPDPTPGQALGLIAFVGGIFALIALMPDFDGWEPGDWGEIGGDEETPRRRR